MAEAMIRALAPILALVMATSAVAESRRTLGGEHLEVRYWPEHEDIALAVLDGAADDLEILTDHLAARVQRTVLIEIVRSREEFDQRAGSKMPYWTLGVSRHHQNHIVLKPIQGKRLRRLVTHELTHVVLDLKMAETRGEPPRWLHEGLAQWMEGDLPSGRKNVLGKAAVGDDLLSLSELESAFDGDRDTVDLAYAQSYTLVATIIEYGPQGALGHFLQYLMDTGDEHVALRRSVGLPLHVIEERWLRDTRTRYLSRGVPMSVELAILAFMGLLFMVVVVVRFRYARAIRRRMQEEERLEYLLGGIEVDDELFEDADDE